MSESLPTTGIAIPPPEPAAPLPAKWRLWYYVEIEDENVTWLTSSLVVDIGDRRTHLDDTRKSFAGDPRARIIENVTADIVGILDAIDERRAIVRAVG